MKSMTSEGKSAAIIVSERRSEKRQNIARIIAAVRGAFLETTRDRILEGKLESFIDLVVGQDAEGRRQDGSVFFLTGESGAGKSTAIRRFLANNAALAPIDASGRRIVPYVSVKGPSPATLQRLGLRICRASGYPAKLDTPEARIWEILKEQLPLRQVLIVHIDEAQHLVRSMKSEHDRTAVANTIKDVIEDRNWPVSFILTGMPVTTELARLDKQILRRHFSMHFQSLDLAYDADRQIVRDLVRHLATEVGGMDSSRLDDEFTGRLAHAADYEIGRISQIIAYAIHQALLRDEGVLTLSHFADAYRASSHTQGLDHLNPFVVRDWAALRAGSFIIPADADGVDT